MALLFGFLQAGRPLLMWIMVIFLRKMFITHLHADHIVVLDDGRVAERGTHAELIKAGGVYAELYELQTRSDAEAVLDEDAA